MKKKVLVAVLLITMAGSVIAAAPVKKQIKLSKNVVVEKQEPKQDLQAKKSLTATLLEELNYEEAKKNIEELLQVDKSDLDANIYLNT